MLFVGDAKDLHWCSAKMMLYVQGKVSISSRKRHSLAGNRYRVLTQAHRILSADAQVLDFQ
jgi:hypothetical protein